MLTHVSRFAVGLGVAFGLMALLFMVAGFLRFNFAELRVALPTGNVPGQGAMCTMEAKLCPDGSAVGRSGPRCEFAPCPGTLAR